MDDTELTDEAWLLWMTRRMPYRFEVVKEVFEYQHRNRALTQLLCEACAQANLHPLRIIEIMKEQQKK